MKKTKKHEKSTNMVSHTTIKPKRKCSKIKMRPPTTENMTVLSNYNNAYTILKRIIVKEMAMTEQRFVHLHRNLRTRCHNFDKDVIFTNMDAHSK